LGIISKKEQLQNEKYTSSAIESGKVLKRKEPQQERSEKEG
jgi:hypothetical protein